MNIIVGEIRVKRGNKANLPVLKPGEPAFCEDTQEYVVGSPNGNIFFPAAGSSSGGGSVPPNVILFEDWTEGETVVIDTSTTPTDTTAPVLTITEGGTFTGTKTVTLSLNETADIFYTLDGSTPTTASAKYTAPLSISATATLKAFARDTAGNVSNVQTVTYTLDTTTPADTTAPNNVTNLQATPTVNSVALSWTASTSSDVASYDIYNGSTLIANVTGTSYNVTGLTASTQYNFSVRAKDGANNVASGTSVNTTTLAPADTTAPVLTMTTAQTFTDSMTVNMSTNETATIWYTIDDSDPITSGTRLQYTAPITITETDTFKAYAVDSANNASAVQTVTYTKDSTAPTVTASLAGGTYTSPQTVSLSANETADIYYTLDGTEPTTSSTKYTTSIAINETKTLKFFGVDAFGNISSVQTNNYTINIPVVIISDSFNRADADVVGTTDQGQTWSEIHTVANVWGIRSNKLYLVSRTNDGVCAIDSGVADCTVEAVMSTMSGVTSARIIGRYVASNNYILVQSGTVYHFNGSWTALTPTSGANATFASGNKVKVDFRGSVITVFVNDVQKATYTTTNTTGTRHGIGSAIVGSQFDDFKIYA